MEWGWMDLEAGMLTIPSEAMKRCLHQKINGRPHFVPLAPQEWTIRHFVTDNALETEQWLESVLNKFEQQVFSRTVPSIWIGANGFGSKYEFAPNGQQVADAVPVAFQPKMAKASATNNSPQLRKTIS